MNTIELSGIIKFEYRSWNRIKLIQKDGYKIDLVLRFQEAIDCYYENMQVSYYLSNSPCTKEEMVEGFLKKLYGYATAEYTEQEVRYSEYTASTDYNSELTIGGHDLYSELQNEEGKFILIELNFTPIK